jgi:lantibiotic modifying enzyme
MSTAPRWTSVLDNDRATVAVAIAREVALRAVDQSRTAEALALARQQSQNRGAVRWEPYALAEGDAGIALMCSYIQQCQPTEDWDVKGHDLLTSAAGALEQAPMIGAGLFGGWSGFAFAVSSLSRDGKRYRRLLSSVHDELYPQILELTTELYHHRAGLGVGQFDVVSGLAGIGANLLKHDPNGQLPRVLACLVWLSGETDGVPRWATPANLMEAEIRDRFPTGSLNCGLAHGIPGPLAVLALATLSGYEVEGQVEAMRRMATWLIEQRFNDDWGATWPSVVPLDAGADHAGRVPTRNAWCYGSPGLARALWLAGEALDDNTMRGAAIDGIRAVLRRPIARRGIDSPTFCHGVAGLLQVVLRFANATSLADLREGAVRLVDQLIAAYQPDRLLGYTSLQPGAIEVDRPGLLDGAPGVAMVLLAAAIDVEPAWDRMFALS